MKHAPSLFTALVLSACTSPHPLSQATQETQEQVIQITQENTLPDMTTWMSDTEMYDAVQKQTHQDALDSMTNFLHIIRHKPEEIQYFYDEIYDFPLTELQWRQRSIWNIQRFVQDPQRTKYFPQEDIYMMLDTLAKYMIHIEDRIKTREREEKFFWK